MDSPIWELIGGHSDSEAYASTQLRDSAGFPPDFPHYFQRLLPAETDRPSL